MKRCKVCGSYAFNLYKEEIDQGDLCDVHYWKEKALAQPEKRSVRTSVDSEHLEPVAWLTKTGSVWKTKMDDTDTPLYTTTPQRTWVGLTDEEKSDIWCVVTNRDFVTEETHVYADAIEAKLKEKNT